MLPAASAVEAEPNDSAASKREHERGVGEDDAVLPLGRGQTDRIGLAPDLGQRLIEADRPPGLPRVVGLADGDPPTGVLVAHEQHEHAVLPFDHGGLVQRPGLVNEGLRVELPLGGLPPFIGAVTELPGLAVVVGVGDRGAHRQPVLVVVEVEGNDEASGVRAVPQGDAVTRAGSQEPHPLLLQFGVEVPRPAPREAVVVGVGDLQVAGGDGQEGLGRVRSGGQLDVARRVAVTQHGAVIQHSELGGLALDRCDRAIGLDDVASVVEVSEQPPAVLVESGGGPAVGLSDPSREVVDEDVDPSGTRILNHAGVDD